MHLHISQLLTLPRATEPVKVLWRSLSQEARLLTAPQVSDVRERRYEASGLGSLYLFRVDDEIVVDATKRVSLRSTANTSDTCQPPLADPDTDELALTGVTRSKPW